ncbi:MAG: Hsp20/alpha crystallin family protein [Acidimicrobiia bacterium]|nr:Hsp20/alpha crystallin family protein [Acidimicrobiia bacterium]
MHMRYDPFTDFDRLWRHFESVPGAGQMPMDAYAKDDEYVLTFDLPGVRPESVDITVENSVLTVTVERPNEDTDGVNWMVRERPTGKHSRQVKLGAKLDSGSISANYDQGVLTVRIPVREDAKPYKVSIGASDNTAIEANATS